MALREKTWMILGMLLLSPLKTERKTRGSLKRLLALSQGGCIFAKLKFKDLVQDHQRGMGRGVLSKLR